MTNTAPRAFGPDGYAPLPDGWIPVTPAPHDGPRNQQWATTRPPGHTLSR